MAQLSQRKSGQESPREVKNSSSMSWWGTGKKSHLANKSQIDLGGSLRKWNLILMWLIMMFTMMFIILLWSHDTYCDGILVTAPGKAFQAASNQKCSTWLQNLTSTSKKHKIHRALHAHGCTWTHMDALCTSVSILSLEFQWGLGTTAILTMAQ